MFQFAQQGFKEYLKQEPDDNIINYFCPKNIDEKIEGYKSQDTKAERSLNNYIQKDEIMQLFKNQKYVCYYCWSKGCVYDWSLDRIDCSKGHTTGNCVIACVRCNKQRKDTFMPKFYRQKALLRFAKTHPMIHLIDEKNKRVYYKIKNNIVGGPSIVYHRYHEKGETKINRVHYNEYTKQCSGLDLQCSGADHQCSRPNLQWYYNDDGKVVSQIVGYDANALYLYCLEQNQLCGKLEWIPTEEEYKIEYENETKDLNEEDLKKYKEGQQLNVKSKQLQKALNSLTSQAKWVEFLGTFFGFIEIDIEIPKDKYEYFGEMPPIFKNIEYSEEEGGEYMKKVIRGIRDKFTTSRKLVAILKASRILIKSTRLKWLLEKSAIVTKYIVLFQLKRGNLLRSLQVGYLMKEERVILINVMKYSLMQLKQLAIQHMVEPE